MSQKRSKRPQCSEDHCGSRRFHEGDDGYTYCDQGHRQSELGTAVAEETGELVMHGKTSRKKDSDVESVASKATGFSGPRAYEHYLLCMQLVLRKQLRWLIDVQNLPEELETLVRDLWALKLQSNRHRVAPEYDTDTEAASSRMMFSSQSEGESGTDVDTVTSRGNRTTKCKKLDGPTLTDLLCMIHTGIMLLRIPLTIADLHEWISSGKLLYYRAAKEVPLSMRDRLPGELQEQLEPQKLIEPEALHRGMLRLLTALNAEFGMVAPPLNHPLILFRWVKELALPLEIYQATQRLSRLLYTDFSFGLHDPAWSKVSLRYPEISLMALIIISTKLLFPFDDQIRYANAASDLAAFDMDWKLWAESQCHRPAKDDDDDRPKALAFDEAFAMTESQSIDLANDRLDQYLDWYEDTIASEEVRERGRAGREADFRRALFSMFPVHDEARRTRAQSDGDAHGSSSADKLLQTQGSLRPRPVAREDRSENVPRAGSAYPRYRTDSELSGTTKVFYERAAQLAGFSLRMMARAVFYMERRLIRHEKDQSTK